MGFKLCCQYKQMTKNSKYIVVLYKKIEAPKTMRSDSIADPAFAKESYSSHN